jgi:hypothetical protein
LDKCGTREELSKDTLNALINEWRDIQKEKEEVENQANSFAKDNKKSQKARDNLLLSRKRKDAPKDSLNASNSSTQEDDLDKDSVEFLLDP